MGARGIPVDFGKASEFRRNPMHLLRDLGLLVETYGLPRGAFRFAKESHGCQKGPMCFPKSP
eukprot:1335646-Pyramimonas_sp.AAC.1